MNPFYNQQQPGLPPFRQQYPPQNYPAATGQQTFQVTNPYQTAAPGWPAGYVMPRYAYPPFQTGHYGVQVPFQQQQMSQATQQPVSAAPPLPTSKPPSEQAPLPPPPDENVKAPAPPPPEEELVQPSRTVNSIDEIRKNENVNNLQQRTELAKVEPMKSSSQNSNVNYKSAISSLAVSKQLANSNEDLSALNNQLVQLEGQMKKYQSEYEKWFKEFSAWRKQHENHPDQKQYIEYQQKYQKMIEQQQQALKEQYIELQNRIRVKKETNMRPGINRNPVSITSSQNQLHSTQQNVPSMTDAAIKQNQNIATVVPQMPISTNAMQTIQQNQTIGSIQHISANANLRRKPFENSPVSAGKRQDYTALLQNQNNSTQPSGSNAEMNRQSQWHQIRHPAKPQVEQLPHHLRPEQQPHMGEKGPLRQGNQEIIQQHHAPQQLGGQGQHGGQSAASIADHEGKTWVGQHGQPHAIRKQDPPYSGIQSQHQVGQHGQQHIGLQGSTHEEQQHTFQTAQHHLQSGHPTPSLLRRGPHIEIQQRAQLEYQGQSRPGHQNQSLHARDQSPNQPRHKALLQGPYHGQQGQSYDSHHNKKHQMPSQQNFARSEDHNNRKFNMPNQQNYGRSEDNDNKKHQMPNQQNFGRSEDSDNKKHHMPNQQNFGRAEDNNNTYVHAVPSVQRQVTPSSNSRSQTNFKPTSKIPSLMSQEIPKKDYYDQEFKNEKEQADRAQLNQDNQQKSQHTFQPHGSVNAAVTVTDRMKDATKDGSSRVNEGFETDDFSGLQCWDSEMEDQSFNQPPLSPRSTIRNKHLVDMPSDGPSLQGIKQESASPYSATTSVNSGRKSIRAPGSLLQGIRVATQKSTPVRNAAPSQAGTAQSFVPRSAALLTAEPRMNNPSQARQTFNQSSVRATMAPRQVGKPVRGMGQNSSKPIPKPAINSAPPVEPPVDKAEDARDSGSPAVATESKLTRVENSAPVGQSIAESIHRGESTGGQARFAPGSNQVRPSFTPRGAIIPTPQRSGRLNEGQGIQRNNTPGSIAPIGNRIPSLVHQYYGKASESKKLNCKFFPNCRYGKSCFYKHPPCPDSLYCEKPECLHDHPQLSKEQIEDIQQKMREKASPQKHSEPPHAHERPLDAKNVGPIHNDAKTDESRGETSRNNLQSGGFTHSEQQLTNPPHLRIAKQKGSEAPLERPFDAQYNTNDPRSGIPYGRASADRFDQRYDDPYYMPPNASEGMPRGEFGDDSRLQGDFRGYREGYRGQDRQPPSETARQGPRNSLGNARQDSRNVNRMPVQRVGGGLPPSDAEAAPDKKENNDENNFPQDDTKLSGKATAEQAPEPNKETDQKVSGNRIEADTAREERSDFTAREEAEGPMRAHNRSFDQYSEDGPHFMDNRGRPGRDRAWKDDYSYDRLPDDRYARREAWDQERPMDYDDNETMQSRSVDDYGRLPPRRDSLDDFGRPLYREDRERIPHRDNSLRYPPGENPPRMPPRDEPLGYGPRGDNLGVRGEPGRFPGRDFRRPVSPPRRESFREQVDFEKRYRDWEKQHFPVDDPTREWEYELRRRELLGRISPPPRFQANDYPPRELPPYERDGFQRRRDPYDMLPVESYREDPRYPRDPYSDRVREPLRPAVFDYGHATKIGLYDIDPWKINEAETDRKPLDSNDRPASPSQRPPSPRPLSPRALSPSAKIESGSRSPSRRRSSPSRHPRSPQRSHSPRRGSSPRQGRRSKSPRRRSRSPRRRSRSPRRRSRSPYSRTRSPSRRSSSRRSPSPKRRNHSPSRDRRRDSRESHERDRRSSQADPLYRDNGRKWEDPRDTKTSMEDPYYKRYGEMNTTPEIKAMEPGPATLAVKDLLDPPGRSSRPKQIVIILRGPPGCGKTHIAKIIKDKEVSYGSPAPRILALDDYFIQETDVYEKDPDTGKKVKVKKMEYVYEEEMEAAYRVSLLKSFNKTLNNGYFPMVIIDAVNDKVEHFQKFWSDGKHKGFEVYIAEMHGDAQDCAEKNIHNWTQDKIQKILDNWEQTPNHFKRLDVRSLVQDAAIEEVEMEEVEQSVVKEEAAKKDEDDDDIDEEDLGTFHIPKKSKWEETKDEQLAKLDGIRHNKKKSSVLGNDDDDVYDDDPYDEREEDMRIGKKRVRWADIEDRKQLEHRKRIGFCIGTDWSVLTDPNAQVPL